MNIDYNDAIHKNYGISLTSRHIIVLIADIIPEDSPILIGTPPTQVDMRKLENDAEIIFKTCLQPLCAERLRMNNFLTLAIGTDEEDDTPELHDKLWSRILKSIRASADSVANLLSLHLHIAVSSIHRNIGNVYDAYWETHAIIEHFTFLNGTQDIITVEDIMLEDDPGEEIRLPLEKQWMSATAAFQFPQAAALLKNIVEAKMGSMRTAVTIKTELFSRMNYVVYFVCDCKGVNHSVREALQNRIQTIWAVHDRQAVLTWIEQIYASVEQVVAMDQRDIVWSERIISFVRSNYMEPQLDVNRISRRFGLNAAYVSHVFRQSTGIRLLDYLHSVRLERITWMLIHTEKSLSDIALETGYGDQQAMSRVFKRYMKMSPTEYRRTHPKPEGN